MKTQNKEVKHKVSLILTTYNCKSDFVKTVKSIESQDYSNIEVCIADSCSTDGTLDAIKDYAGNSKNTVLYISEKDSGIYDGLNKAIAMSTGDYIEIMNDEYTCKNAISLLVNAIEQCDDSYVGVHSDLVYKEEEKIRRYWKMGQGSIKLGWMPGHPSLMLKREIYQKYGMYDTSYICSADYEFMVRFLKDDNHLVYVNETLISMYYGGTSTGSAARYFTSIKESIRALKNNNIKCPIIITILRTIRVSLQFLQSKRVQ